MPVVIDARPPGVNVVFRPGDPFTLTLTWQDEAGVAVDLTGRTFTATLDAASLAVGVLANVVTVSATAAQTTAAAESGVFLLTETTGVDAVVVVGTWVRSTSPAAATRRDGIVVVDDFNVTVTVPGGGTFADLTATGDATVGGQLLTGSPFAGGSFDADAIVFGGIEGEGRVIGAPAMAATAGATLIATDGVARWSLPANQQNSVFCVFALEEWWLDSTIAVFVEWNNDHTGTGDVGWAAILKEIDIGTQGPATAGTEVATTLEVQGSQPAGRTHTYTVCSQARGNSWTPSPGPFASYYALELRRLGDNVLDTLEGPVGIIEVSYVRGK